MKTTANMICRGIAFFALASFGPLLSLQAVSPAPDGGYAGNNTAEGTSALFSRTSGVNDTALGFQALYHDTTGQGNTATGRSALFSNMGGSFNTANGEFALYSNVSGISNTALGDSALLTNNSGSSNTALGVSALRNNSGGNQNTAVGHNALVQNNASGNTAVGYEALLSNAGGVDNTATGYQALLGNTSGYYNVASGAGSLFNNTSGAAGIAIGNGALFHNTTGTGNTALGFQALFNNTGGVNTAVGNQALFNNTSGLGNIGIGYHSGSNVSTANNVICIGSFGGNVTNSTWINNIYGVTTQSGVTLPVAVSNTGQLGTSSSSARFKKHIAPMEKTSEAILALHPVTFQYKADNTNTPQFGLVAEDVAKVDPDLVVRDDKGEIYTVRYEAVNAMLLNEFLKEHKKIDKQQATITRLEKQVEALTAGLQKVSAQLERTYPAPHVIADEN